MDIADSVKDSVIMNNVLEKETFHFNGVSLTLYISLSRSRSPMCIKTKSISIMDTLIEEEKCEEEPKGLESQKKYLEIQSLFPAPRSPFREDPMEEIEQNFLHTGESSRILGA